MFSSIHHYLLLISEISTVKYFVLDISKYSRNIYPSVNYICLHSVY